MSHRGTRNCNCKCCGERRNVSVCMPYDDNDYMCPHCRAKNKAKRKEAGK